MENHKIEKAVNIAIGCLMASPLSGKEKTEIIDALRYMEERHQNDRKINKPVTKQEAMEAWVSGKSIIATDESGNVSLIESYKKLGMGCVVKFPGDGSTYHIIAEYELDPVTQDLRKLIIENPELEVVPFVREECSNPDYLNTMACLAEAVVEEYAVSPYCDERVFFKSGGLDDYFIEEYYDYDPYERDVIPDEEVKAAFQSLEWVKAILIFIDAY